MSGGGDEQARAVGRREHQRLGARLADVLARRVAEVEAGDGRALALTPEHGRAVLGGKRLRVLDIGAAENALVAGGQRLSDSRGGPQDVDDDREWRVNGLKRSKGHMNTCLVYTS